MELPTRTIAVVALLALVPLALYGLGTGRLDLIGWAVGVANVLLIAGMLALALGPVDDADHNGEPAH